MKSVLIILKSMTEAGKARYHLEKFRIEGIVEKVTLKSGGCGYGIRVKDDPEKVSRILSIAGIESIEIR